jgi:hypothetical protein
VQVGEFALDPRDALRGGQDADRGDVVGTAVHQELDRRGKRATGRQHRVEHVALPAVQVLRETFGVRRGGERLLVADHPEEADLGRREQPRHPLEHAETGAQDRDDERLGGGQLDALGVGDRRGDGDRAGPDIPGGLVREQRDELLGQPPEGRRVRPLVPQGGELVGDEWVVHDEDLHVRNGTVGVSLRESHCPFRLEMQSI